MKIFRDARTSGIIMTNSILLREARLIGEKKKDVDFVGTISWLRGVKKRNNIVYRRNTKIAQKMPLDAVEKVDNFTNEVMELLELHKYSLEAIVNIDGTGVFFDTCSNQMLEFKFDFFNA